MADGHCIVKVDKLPYLSNGLTHRCEVTMVMDIGHLHLIGCFSFELINASGRTAAILTRAQQ